MHEAETSYAKRYVCWKSGDKFKVPVALRSRGAAPAWIRWGHFWGHFFDTQSKILDFMRVRRHCSIALLPPLLLQGQCCSGLFSWAREARCWRSAGGTVACGHPGFRPVFGVQPRPSRKATPSTLSAWARTPNCSRNEPWALNRFQTSPHQPAGIGSRSLPTSAATSRCAAQSIGNRLHWNNSGLVRRGSCLARMA